MRVRWTIGSITSSMDHKSSNNYTLAFNWNMHTHTQTPSELNKCAHRWGNGRICWEFYGHFEKTISCHRCVNGHGSLGPQYKQNFSQNSHRSSLNTLELWTIMTDKRVPIWWQQSQKHTQIRLWAFWCIKFSLKGSNFNWSARAHPYNDMVDWQWVLQ